MSKHRGGWFKKGASDREKGKFQPPDGTSWSDTAQRQLAGQSKADKAYHKGWKTKKGR